MLFDFEMIKSVYQNFPEKINAAKKTIESSAHLC
ncbi:MAG: hypothetical protein KatS3mg027_1455 [Bacteroidia bacterium]|nr:MAG: hypothetical protein KatS3mg027_1455 [Bacteroidia bacterium]